jgi:hypothetical protein
VVGVGLVEALSYLDQNLTVTQVASRHGSQNSV